MRRIKDKGVDSVTIVIYSALHFLVDFVCAWAMMSWVQKGSAGYLGFLIYNFCAFALQMPLGTLLDLAEKSGKKKLSLIWSGAGLVVTLTGALMNPAVLGLGNALFHVGSGMVVIREDFAQNRGGQNLGIFVAPGAVGLYLGSQLAGKPGPWLPLCAVAMAGLIYILINCSKSLEYHPPQSGGRNMLPLTLCCFAVVVLRSWVGLGIPFGWKAEFGLASVFAVAAGKVLGGVISLRFGMGKTVRWSLLLAALCYLFSENTVFGILALLLFNMSMPITLYMLATRMPGLPGFSFGLLSFGLFLGFLPVYMEAALPLPGPLFGAAASLISMVLLLAAEKEAGYGRILS